MPKTGGCRLFREIVKNLPYLDLKQHWQEWHRYFLPIFVVVAAIGMILILVIRNASPDPSSTDSEKSIARIGLLEPRHDALFDPGFAVSSPTEMVLTPTTNTFDYPVGSRHGALTYNAQPFMTDRHLGDDLNGIGGWNSDLGDPVYAIADGLVTFAGWPSDGWGNVVILAHKLENGQLIDSFYGHLNSIRVPVGRQLRRGDLIGTIGTANERYLAHLHFELRRYPALDVGMGYFDSKLGRLSGELSLKKWRQREESSLTSAPVGAPLPQESFQLEVVEEVDPAP